MSQPVSIPAAFDDWCTLAQRRLPNFLFGYVDGGSLDEHTLRANVSAWRQVHLRQHVLRDVSACQSGIRFFGVDARVPLAPGSGGAGWCAAQAWRGAARWSSPWTWPTCAMAWTAVVVRVRRCAAWALWLRIRAGPGTWRCRASPKPWLGVADLATVRRQHVAD
ncbi:alpha-hydroxy-acid oxidizing protein [Acidovorax sp.]|uniref:alpha-hydroxy-acid oxidizing protein n=1 Tax=Acidovorax sp. TaxID=1872122 RepID=UPI0026181C2E|nr:alpha-hydroxy-acid oxidizing protein [Acidovorax sp.]